MRTIVFGTFACLFLSACASNKIYSPIRITCWDINTGEMENNTALAGIAVGTGWYKTDRPLLEYTDIKRRQVTVDLTHSRCAIAAYRGDK